MPITDYSAHLMMDALAGGTSYQGPSTVYLALAITTPTFSVAGTEVTYTGYTRKTFAQSGWTNDAAGKLTLTANAAWATASSDGDDEVVAVEAYSAGSGGNRLWYIVLAQPKLIVSGETPQFLAGDLELRMV